MSQDTRHRTFHSSLQGFAWLAGLYGVLGLYLLVGAVVAWRHIYTLKAVASAPPTYDPLGLAFILGRIAIALFIFMRITAEYLLKAGCKVVITPSEAICSSRYLSYSFPYHASFATYSPFTQYFYRAVTLAHGAAHYRIEAFYFPEFALLERVLVKALDKNLHVPKEDEFNDDPVLPDRKVQELT
ncbi:MAG TPA: hypothetical protein VGO93_14870 [Candidatus Xenobia bacterium]|jgi:hypothetical protein